MNYPKLFQSSENQANLSLTIKAIVGFALLTFGGQEVANAFSNDIANALVTIIVAGGQVIAAVGVLWGLVRKWRNASKTQS